MKEKCFNCGKIVDVNKEGHLHNEECEYTGCNLCDNPKIAKALNNKFFCHYECTIAYLKHFFVCVIFSRQSFKSKE